MTYLIIENMQFYAFHGVMGNERKVGGEYSVTLKIGYDFVQASQTDDINAAIDYGCVYDLIKEEMKVPSRLIEHLAQRIQDRVVRAYPQIQTMETSVSKHRPPVEGIIGKATVVLQFAR